MQFTVVTPSLDQAQFVRDAIESVINQTYSDIQYVVVDGVSEDDSVDVISEYNEKIDVFISEPDEGQSDAINKGFSFGTGEIFAYLNSDDYYFIDAIRIVAEYFENNPDVDVVYGDCVFVDESGQFIRYFSEISDYDEDRLRNYSDIIMQPATFWRASVFRKYGPFDKNLHFGFDWAFWCELARQGCRMERIPYVLAANRVYPDTKTLSGSIKRVRELGRINAEYGTRWLRHAYYRYALSDLIDKRDWNVLDYMKFPFLVMLSYGNIIHHFRNYRKKIVHGLVPKSGYVLKEAAITIPRLDYDAIRISLSARIGINQRVTVTSNGESIGEFEFHDGSLVLDIDLDSNKDVDIGLVFDNEYKLAENLYQRLLMLDKPTNIAAEISEIQMHKKC